mgnify:CR=1 FL=1
MSQRDGAGRLAVGDLSPVHHVDRGVLEVISLPLK